MKPLLALTTLALVLLIAEEKARRLQVTRKMPMAKR